MYLLGRINERGALSRDKDRIETLITWSFALYSGLPLDEQTPTHWCERREQYNRGGVLVIKRLERRVSRTARLSVFAAGMCFVAVTLANPYTVQIGAFKQASADYGDKASGVGEVFSQVSQEGLTQVMVGRYDDIDGARKARVMLLDLGYADAFVKSLPDAAPADDVATRSAVEQIAIEPAPAETEVVPVIVETVTTKATADGELGREVVNLDGVPHIKDGDSFIPLNDD